MHCYLFFVKMSLPKKVHYANDVTKRRPEYSMDPNASYIHNPVQHVKRLKEYETFQNYSQEKVAQKIPPAIYVALLSFAPYRHRALHHADILFKEELQYFAAEKQLFTTRKSKRRQLEGRFPFNPVSKFNMFSNTECREVLAINPSYTCDHMIKVWEAEFNNIRRLKRIGLQTIWLTSKMFHDSTIDPWDLCQIKFKAWRVGQFNEPKDVKLKDD